MRRGADENMVKVGQRNVPKSVGDYSRVFFDGEAYTSGLSLSPRRLGSKKPPDLTYLSSDQLADSIYWFFNFPTLLISLNLRA